MFRYEKCSHQMLRCAKHDRNMFILSMIEQPQEVVWVRVRFGLELVIWADAAIQQKLLAMC